MGEQTVHVTIAGRTYPVTVPDSDAERIKQAAGKVGEKISAFEKTYGVKDKQDLLAMCVLQFATQYLELENKSQIENGDVAERLEELEKFVSEYLKKDRAA